MNNIPSYLCLMDELKSPSGLCFELTGNGAVRRILCDSVVLNLFTGNALEGGLSQIYLRKYTAEGLESTPLLGPESPSAFGLTAEGWFARGVWHDIGYELHLVLAAQEPVWFWHVKLTNIGPVSIQMDLLHTQDMGLTHYGNLRLNEYYVSQYLDFSPLWHERNGWVLAVRQNQPVAGRYPWVLLGSLAHSAGFATDALQFQGLSVRAGQQPAALSEPQLPNRRWQHEHALAALADAPFTLEPEQQANRGFYGYYRADHPAASHDADLAVLKTILGLPEARAMASRAVTVRAAVPTLFSPVRWLESLDFSEPELREWFGADWQQVERENGELLSFFGEGQSHVVLKAKELKVLRPHGHILRTGASLIPDEAALTSTVWMNGVFNSMLTQGHVSINRLLSTTRSYLSLFRSHGQRIFVELDDGYRLLDVPSAFEMTPNACRWFYRWADGLIVVSNTAGWQTHTLNLSIEIFSGQPRRWLLCQEMALNGDDGAVAWPVSYGQNGQSIEFLTIPDTELGQRFPAGRFRLEALAGTVIEAVARDERLFADETSRRLPFITVQTAAASRVEFCFTGQLVTTESTADQSLQSVERFWQDRAGVFSGGGTARAAASVQSIQAILPWFAHNALIHFLAPRGLEQFSGGGWGVRDVTQGPVEMLLAEGCLAPVRDLLLRVFKAQNPEGDWPQWFMFFERESAIRPADSHGDIVFWPILATARYLLASGEAGFLDECVPYYEPDAADRTPGVTVRQHLEQAFAVIAARRIEGTHLAAYGHGDWNDSLQPVDPAMRERLCSSWTVTLHYQTLTTLAAAYQKLDKPDDAARLQAEAAAIRQDFRRYLLVDGVLTGFAHFQASGAVDYLVHPRDTHTGLRFSLLPMIHAIRAELLTPAEASEHLALIDQQLKGPDGARLFDRPPPYRGGPQHYFQRAESAAYFGREIGLMYTHAHLRYAEALALMGRAEAFFEALCLAIPIGLREQVPSAALRQANCYYSSSDAAFADRYEALAEYARVASGDVALEGGWRVYSSGAGIAVRLIRECWLGLLQEHDRLIIDPVLAPVLDGLTVTLSWNTYPLTLVYRVGPQGYGPYRLVLNGAELDYQRQANPYRNGGVIVAASELSARMQPESNRLQIDLG